MSSCPTMMVVDSSFIRRCEIRSRVSRRMLLALAGSVWTIMICKIVIACVSAFDTYLTIKYAESLDIYEQNPVGRWLMGLDQGPVVDTQQIAAFVTAKFLGTMFVLLAIQGLMIYRVRLASMIALPVAGFQLSLIAHLLFGAG